MEFVVVTWGKKVYTLTESQCQKFADAYVDPDNKSIPLPSGNLITSSDVRYVGSKKDMPYVENKNYIPPGQMSIESPHENIGYLMEGEAPKMPKDFRLKLKKIWFEHVKNRPSINEMAKKRRLEIWQNSLRHLSPSERMKARMPRFLLEPEYSSEELRIMSTPIDQLMEDFTKTLFPKKIKNG